MKPFFLLFTALLLASCQLSPDEQAARALQRIDSLYASHNYQATLNAIRQLRDQYPRAIKAREKALKIWQEASLKMTQQEIGLTDSALQAVTTQWKTEQNIGRRNRLRAQIDSLQVRYDALCGTVRVIHRRQRE
ncbi:MAG: hypothetical protein HXL33_03235 [Prevotellaceae bacterium]|nr:hypothetical protein [Prevotellaceae bacterium]